MRTLGIDYGKKRVGIALSDEEGRIAFPHSVILNDGDLKVLSEKIFEICQQNSVDTVVIGESKDYSGADNSIMNQVRSFAETFQATSGIEPVYESEVLSSHQASKMQNQIDSPGRKNQARQTARQVSRQVGGKTGKETNKSTEGLDASAAAIILQSYLNRLQYEINKI